MADPKPTRDERIKFAEKERWFGKYQAAAERAEKIESLLRKVIEWSQGQRPLPALLSEIREALPK